MDDDIIRMPGRERFVGSDTCIATEAYRATLLHEPVHWTGSESRRRRRFGWRFGDGAYAKEELIAELRAAFLCADLGVTLEPRPDHAQYIADWLEVLRKDNEAIITATRSAQKAVDFLTGLQSTRQSGRTRERPRRPRGDWRTRGSATRDSTSGWRATARSERSANG